MLLVVEKGDFLGQGPARCAWIFLIIDTCSDLAAMSRLERLLRVRRKQLLLSCILLIGDYLFLLLTGFLDELGHGSDLCSGVPNF